MEKLNLFVYFTLLVFADVNSTTTVIPSTTLSTDTTTYTTTGFISTFSTTDVISSTISTTSTDTTKFLSETAVIDVSIQNTTTSSIIISTTAVVNSTSIFSSYTSTIISVSTTTNILVITTTPYIDTNETATTLSSFVTNATSAPNTDSYNIFSFDSRIANILMSFFSNYSQVQILSLASSQQAFLSLIDTISPNDWEKNCTTANLFYQYLEDQLVINRTNITTYERLNKILGCKSDCNFVRLLSKQSVFTSYCDPQSYKNCSTIDFATDVVTYLPSDIVKQCRIMFPFLVNLTISINASQLLKNIQQISFLTPNQMDSFTASDSIKIAQQLTLSKTKLNPSLAKSLGSNIPINANLSVVASIASSIPIECFINSSPASLVSNLDSLDLDNMNTFRKALIATQVSSSGSATLLSDLLLKTTDSSIVNSIPTNVINQLKINISNIPATNLPKAYLKFYSRNVLSTNSLSNITDLVILSKILSDIKNSDFSNVSDSLKLSTMVQIVTASLNNGIDLTSKQRSIMLNSLLNSLAILSNSSNSSVYLNLLNQTHIYALYPLFLESNSTILEQFSKMNTFSNLITVVSKIPLSKCCLYSRVSRKLFASYAVPYKFNYTSLYLNDLYMLGPCIVSVLPYIYLKNMNPYTFVAYYSTLGRTFQPDSIEIGYVQQLISSYSNNITLMSTYTQDTLFFTKLSDLAMFYPFTSYANNITSWVLNGESLYSSLISTRDPSLTENQLCQIGLNNTANYTSIINLYGLTFLSQFTSKMTGVSRKKRAIYVYTCSDLINMGTTIKNLSPNDLSSISLNDFYSCQTLLGTYNFWSTLQLQALAGKAKSYYGSISNISNKNLLSLNTIIVGFNSTDLANLNLTSLTTLNMLGTLTGWSYSLENFAGVYQINSFIGPVTKYLNDFFGGIVNSTFISSAANLLCCLTQAQISGISESDLKLSVGSLKMINIICPNMANWYTFVKNTTTYSNLLNSTSALAELGSVIAGITSSDLAQITPDSIGSISNLALSFMPASTLNTLKTTQLAGLSIDQVVALQQSPYYSMFSPTISKGLNSLIQGLQPIDITSNTLTKFNLSLSTFFISFFLLFTLV